MRSYVYILVSFTFLFSNCLGQKSKKSEKNRVVVISTQLGEIKIKLYDETPKHCDNFTRLVSEKFYDDQLFHRVIAQFMIQGGDPDSKNAASGKALGNGGPGYTIPAEFNDKLVHKRGAVAAARLGDNVNPNKESSGSQFYIVQGRVFTNAELDQMEMNINSGRKNSIIENFINEPENKSWKRKIDSLQTAHNYSELNALVMELEKLTAEQFKKEGVFAFSPEIRKIYTTMGGSPHLDGGYTVFGEVIEGMDIVDKIAAVKTDKASRPLEDIKFQIKTSK